jgi:hypothetical protein
VVSATADTARAIVNVVQSIIDRGQRAPSTAVQVKAARLLGRPGISWRTPALVFDIPSGAEPRDPVTLAEQAGLAKIPEPEWRTYAVALYTRGTQRRAGRTIVAGRCWCANNGELQDLPSDGARVCSHLLVALTLATLEGYSLEER